jgi:lysophospholipid acyltransferase (LPLAT)-like uncharacterized protein
LGVDPRGLARESDSTHSFILASFHECAIACVFCHIGRGIACLASRSKDGEIISFICRKFGLKAVRGSSSRGGQEARDELISLLKQGVSAAISIDGPRGPRRIAKPGVVDLARKSGAVVVPITAVGDREWVLKKTWDQTKLPKPFSRVLIYYGRPLSVTPNVQGAEFDAIKEAVASSLISDDMRLRKDFEQSWVAAKHPG